MFLPSMAALQAILFEMLAAHSLFHGRFDAGYRKLGAGVLG